MGELLCYLWAGDGGGHLLTFFIPATFLRATLFLHLDKEVDEVDMMVEGGVFVRVLLALLRYEMRGDENDGLMKGG